MEQEGTHRFFQAGDKRESRELIKAAPKILALSLQACNLAFSRGNRKQSQERSAGKPSYLSADTAATSRVSEEGPSRIRLHDNRRGGFDSRAAREKRLAAGKGPQGLPGVFSGVPIPLTASFKQGETLKTEHSLKMPTYDWFKDIGIYRNHRNHYRLTPIAASRGCRWSRDYFCAERLSGDAPFAKKSVVDEFEWLADRGCDQFMFNESDLNGSIESLHAICAQNSGRNQ